MGEHRPGDETHLAPPARRIFVDNLRADDVRGHQVRRELYALELQVQNPGERADQAGFRQSRRAGDQAVAAGKQHDEQLLDHFVLPDDHPPDFPQEFFPPLTQPGQGFLFERA